MQLAGIEFNVSAFLQLGHRIGQFLFVLLLCKNFWRDDSRKADYRTFRILQQLVKGLPDSRIAFKDHSVQGIVGIFRHFGRPYGAGPEVYALIPQERVHLLHCQGVFGFPHADIVPDVSDFVGNAQFRYR